MRRFRRSVLVGLVVGMTGVFTASGARETATPPPTGGSQEVDVVAVFVDPLVQAPKVVLERKRDRRRLEMVIGLAEMNGIAIPLNGVTPPRPLTHDLFLTLFGRLKVNLTRVVINDLRDDIYYATLHLSGGAGPMTLDSRPSDAIALAVRARVPVLVEDRVFDKTGPSPTPRRPSI
jgi:bifunctional DNase/RNase